MQLRRVLILFAVVLGLAGLAALVSQPSHDRGLGTTAPGPPPEPRAAPGPASVAPAGVSFSELGRRRTMRLAAGRAATVTVRVRQPGQVELEGLGLTAAAEPLTPARFEVLAREPGRYAVRFTPAGDENAKTLGVLRVVQQPPAT